MTKEQFEKLLEKLDDISKSISYVGNMLEDHARFNSEGLASIANTIDNK